MTQPWDEYLMLAKYHYSVAERLFNNFSDYETKRFLSSCLNEMALCASAIVNTTLVYFNIKEGARIPIAIKARIEIFKKRSEKKFGENYVKNILSVFKIKTAQKNSPIELLKKDKIILLDNGEYKALTLERIKELLNGLNNNIKQVSKEI